MLKKLLSLTLTMAMVVGLLPTTAMAYFYGEPTVSIQTYDALVPAETADEDKDAAVALALAKLLVGEDVEIKEGTAWLKYSDKAQVAAFTDSDGDPLGIASGVMLSTGDAYYDFKGDSQGAYDESGINYKDEPLAKLIESEANRNPSAGIRYGGDTAMLEFQMVATGEDFSFEYAFASAEFDQPPKYNDIFGLFVKVNNGDFENIAKLPNGENVTITSLRTDAETNPYGSPLDDELADGTKVGYITTDMSNSKSNFNGYSNVFTAEKKVKIDDTVTIRFVIADVSDCSVNSAVFIHGGSLSFNAKSKNPLTAPDGSVELELAEALTNVAQQVVVKLDGTPLVQGEDYTVTIEDPASPTAPVITFNNPTGLNSNSKITVEVTLESGETQTVIVTNNIPAPGGEGGTTPPSSGTQVTNVNVTLPTPLPQYTVGGTVVRESFPLTVSTTPTVTGAFEAAGLPGVLLTESNYMEALDPAFIEQLKAALGTDPSFDQACSAISTAAGNAGLGDMDPVWAIIAMNGFNAEYRLKADDQIGMFITIVGTGEYEFAENVAVTLNETASEILGEASMSGKVALICGHVLGTPTPPPADPPVGGDDEPTGYSIYGTVDTGATVKLMQGSTLIESFTAEAGNYLFEDVAPGSYNLVVAKDGKTMTDMVVVATEDVEKNITLPADDVNSNLDVKDNTPNVAVGGLKEEAEQHLEEEKAANSGATSVKVDVEMTVETKVSNNVADSDKAAIDEIVADADKQLEYLDIVITKTVTVDGTPGEGTPITETKGMMTIVIPFDFSNKSDVAVYRYHDSDLTDSNPGEAIAMTQNPTSGQEGFQLGTDCIIIYAKKFSTYAIGYSTGGSGSNPGTPAPNPPVYGGPTMYWVETLDAEHGTVKAGPLATAEGGTVTAILTPDSGYELAGLLITDAEGAPVQWKRAGDGRYSFAMPAGGATVSATFRPVSEECDEGELCPIHPYTDTDSQEWYHDGVHYCLEQGLMIGHPGNRFDPDGITTRAQIVTTLWRLEGEPLVETAEGFNDVLSGAWYYDAVRWATACGIIEGYGDGNFGPNDTLTREQVIAILWRAAKYLGCDVSVGEDTNILSYTDFNQIDSYAVPAMQWACGAGLLDGTPTEGTGLVLEPKGATSRAMLATLLMRFCEYVVK